jgi:hypothetical protein
VVQVVEWSPELKPQYHTYTHTHTHTQSKKQNQTPLKLSDIWHLEYTCVMAPLWCRIQAGSAPTIVGEGRPQPLGLSHWETIMMTPPKYLHLTPAQTKSGHQSLPDLLPTVLHIDYTHPPCPCSNIGLATECLEPLSYLNVTSSLLWHCPLPVFQAKAPGFPLLHAGVPQDLKVEGGPP